MAHKYNDKELLEAVSKAGGSLCGGFYIDDGVCEALDDKRPSPRDCYNCNCPTASRGRIALGIINPEHDE